MKKTTMMKLILLISFSIHGICKDMQSGHVTFDVDKFPDDLKAHKKPQQVMFLGCKTQRIVDYNWAQKGQKTSLPYTIKDKRCPNGTCVASKYYMASPPIFVGNQAILGQLKPDHFTWNADNLLQEVEMDYSVLEPVTLGEIHANFDHMPKIGGQSCEEQQVELVPINIDCANLPKIHGKMGASGIGFLKSKQGKSQIFIPHVGPQKHKTLVQCNATILDDIVLGHNIYFDDEGTYRKSISMTKLFNNNAKMNFVCEKRQVNDVPAGCLDGVK